MVRRPYMAVKPKKRKAAAKPEVPKIGRPEEYSQHLADKILDRMVAGETLTAICRDDDMPHRTTVGRWARRNEEFRRDYGLARELLADHYADDVIAIADDATGDLIKDAKGKPQVDWESVQRSRLRCDSRKWLASKLFAAKYGDKIAHTGAGDGPIKLEQALIPDEVAATLVELLTAAERELGIPARGDLPNEERLKEIRKTGLPPSLYQAAYQLKRGPDDPVH